MLQQIGKRIKQLRMDKLNMTQEDFAKTLGVDRTYLSRIESGKQNITVNTLVFICNKLDVTLKEFFSDFNNEKGCGK